MSTITVLPIKWFINDDWTCICLYGKTKHGKSIYAQGPFQNYLLVHGESLNTEYYTKYLPICNIRHLGNDVYKIYVTNRAHYNEVETYFQQKKFPHILNSEQNILNKYFQENNIVPGNLQELFNIKPLTNVLPQRICDFEFHFTNMTSIHRFKECTVDFFQTARTDISSIELNKVFLDVQENYIYAKAPGNQNIIFMNSPSAILNNVQIVNVQPDEIVTKCLEWIKKMQPDYIIHYNKSVPNSLLTLKEASSEFSWINLAVLYQREFLFIPSSQQELSGLEKYMFQSMTQADIPTLLEKLWNDNALQTNVSCLSNFWKADLSTLLDTGELKLISDLHMCLLPTIRLQINPTLHSYEYKRKTGIYTKIHIYSLSNMYLEEMPNDALTEHFRQSQKGALLFFAFNTGVPFLNSLKMQESYIFWIHNNELWTSLSLPMLELDAPKIILSSTDRCLYMSKMNDLLDVGRLDMGKQECPLILHYIEKIMQFVIENPNREVELPPLTNNVRDYECVMRIYHRDYYCNINFDSRCVGSSNKRTIIDQMKHTNSQKLDDYEDVTYIMTQQGPVIKKIYDKDIYKYANLIDMDYYKQLIKETLGSILE